MVFVNSKKFACESCIKGHRSSACAHTDRPLFEIKKKGRPISQCETCRSLRQSRKMHSKCVCGSKDKAKPDLLPLPASAGAKAKRFIPIAPALPNGLKDLQSSSQCTITIPSDKRQRVTSLLNPCLCKDPWRCKCIKNQSQSTSSSGNKNSPFGTLAKATSCCSGTNTESSPRQVGLGPRSTSPLPGPPSKRVKHSHKHSHQHSHSESPPPSVELPPLLFSCSDSSVDSSLPLPTTVPDFGIMPSLSEISSLAGSGCTCGVECNCPGCVEHRGPEHADTAAYGSCSEGCGTCVDNTHGIALPGLSGSDVTATTSIIDRFFARAASLPSPPVNRKMGVGVQIDPMNVMVYPKTAIETKERGVPFGLITVPKLECCGGKCGCPAGECGCGKNCDGCCDEHNHEKEEENRKRGGVGNEEEVRVPESVQVPILAAVRSCCSGKV